MLMEPLGNETGFATKARSRLPLGRAAPSSFDDERPETKKERLSTASGRGRGDRFRGASSGLSAAARELHGSKRSRRFVPGRSWQWCSLRRARARRRRPPRRTGISLSASATTRRVRCQSLAQAKHELDSHSTIYARRRRALCDKRKTTPRRSTFYLNWWRRARLCD
jgi:hypothetical protein